MRRRKLEGQGVSFNSVLWAACSVIGSGIALGQEPVEVPQLAAPELEMVLYAQEPMIQHPVAALFDERGRLLVVENHTHFRKEDWNGPTTDRLVLLIDDDRDGRADRRQVFFEGTENTMGLALGPEGWIYVSCRNEILRLRDADGDGEAEEVVRNWIDLKTEVTYPHNGMSGVAVDSKGGLYFGLGENFGGAYELHCQGSSVSMSEGEGGSIWHVDHLGKGLKRFASGFWNPFGLALNAQGDLFATDNDADSRPPSRLIHVTREGDYGFQFRYGRSGLHPFVSWNGERLGTLPPLAPTGEAPCGLIYYLPKAHAEYRGLPGGWLDRLLVASWADHRIDGYITQSRPGSSTFNAGYGTLCQGGADFRPVSLTVASDGSLYVTDWVKRSYESHGYGRVWIIRLKGVVEVTGINLKPKPADPGLDRVEEILSGPAPSAQDILGWLQADEPRLFHAAVERLSREGRLAKDLAVERFNLDGRVRGGLLLASRRGTEREGLDMERLPEEVGQLLQGSLADADEAVLLLALHWVSDHRIHRYQFMVQGLIDDATMSPAIHLAAVTALRRIRGESIDQVDLAKAMLERLGEDSLSPELARLILRSIPSGGAQVKASQVLPLIATAKEDEDRVWLIHFLGLLEDSAKQDALKTLFDVESAPLIRSAVLSHLAPTTVSSELVGPLIAEESYLLRSAALAFIQGDLASAETQRAIRGLKGTRFESAGDRALGLAFVPPNRPAETELRSWLSYLERLPGDADPTLGAEVFLSARRGGCAQCHRKDGLGAAVGPELSGLAEAGATLESVLRAILQPSAEISPSHEAWKIVTRDGAVHVVSLVDERGGKHRYIDAEGTVYEWEIDEMVVRQRVPLSIMPAGIVTRLTDEEIRDLLAYLLADG